MSDVHLGDVYADNKAFYEFLTDIKEKRTKKELPRLQALIILGDFFDAIMDSYLDLITKHTDIYNAVDDLIRDGIRVIVALGNHEVYTTGDYNEDFEKNKIALIDKFKGILKERKLPIPLFLDKDNFCQYIVLRPSSILTQNTSIISCYDSMNKDGSFDDQNEISFVVFNISLPKDYLCLMCHGFQFEGNLTHRLASLAWKAAMDLPDESKSILNDMWHVISGKGKVKTQRREVSRSYKKTRKALRKGGRNKDNKYYNKRIAKFAKKTGITDVIFGHTHSPEDVTHKKIHIQNTGCWIDRNDFIEII